MEKKIRLALISDSHGNKLGIEKLMKEGNFDYLFFMGDGLNDLGSYYYMDNVFAVSGNCDFFSEIENEKFVTLGGKNIWFTHGNKYGVKYGLEKLISMAKEVGANLVFYGHTHHQVAEEIDGIYFINPGKFYRNPDGESNGLYVIIEDNKISIESLNIIAK